MGIASLAALTLTALAGCSSIYEAPPGDKATLIIDNPNEAVPLWAWTYKVAADCRNPVKLTLNPIPQNRNSTPIAIAAGQEFSITLYGRGYGEECYVTGTFVPASGATYRAAYRWGIRDCNMRVLDVGTSAAHPVVAKRTILERTEPGEPNCRTR